MDSVFTREIPVEKGWVIVEFLRRKKEVNLYYTLYDIYTSPFLLLRADKITSLNVTGRSSFSTEYTPSSGKLYVHIYVASNMNITVKKYIFSPNKHYFGIAIYAENASIV